MFCACRDCTSSNEPLINPTPLALVEYLYKANLGLPDSSPDEQALASDLLKWREYLAHIDAEISRSPPKVEDWVSKREDISAYLHKHTAIRHPIRQLPADVLTEIFLLVLQLDSRPESADSVDIHKAPWTFTHVSSFWRRSALTFPGLWSEVSMQLEAWNFRLPTHRDAFNGLLKLQLQRSGEGLLRVFFLRTREMYPSFNGDGLSMVMHESHRWHELQLWHPMQALPRLASLEGKLPRLQILSFCGPSSASFAHLVTLFRTLPSLKEIRGQDDCLDSKLLLPWSQVTSLSTNGVAITNHRLNAIIPQLQSLVTANLITHYQLGQPTSPPSVLPNLSFLTLETSGKRATSEFFSMITAPQLRSLNIVYGNAMAALISFQQRSNFNLRSLSIPCSGIEVPDYVRFLSSLPALESLTLRVCSDQNFILTLGQSQEIVPQLRNCIIQGLITSHDGFPVICEGLQKARPQLAIGMARQWQAARW